MLNNSGMMPARLAWILVLTLACRSYVPPTEEAVSLHGIVTNVDTANQTISLSWQEGDSRTQNNDIHYNTLTTVDTPWGSLHVDQLKFGVVVAVYGRRDLATDVVMAEQIVVIDSK